MAFGRNRKERPSRPAAERRLSVGNMQRVLVLAVIFGVLTFLVLFAKLWQLQVVQHEYLENRAITQQTREISSTANRGTIYDANGNVLAISGAVQNVVLSPRDLVKSIKVDAKDEFGNERSEKIIEAERQQKLTEKSELIANELFWILGTDPDEVREELEKTDRAYVVLAKKVEDDIANKVRQFIVDYELQGCVYLTSDSKRYYPYSTLASQVVGFVNG